jgi:3-oxoacyl-[acyl-carrier-protein] synthase-3
MVTHNNGHYPRRNDEVFAHIVGWGMAVPEQILTNSDLEAIVETSDEWIRSRTGIRERRIAGEHESTATLGLKAAQRALEVANVLPLELDLVVVATSTPEHIFPSTASMIQDWLGATKAGAFDLSAACAGFVYAVNMAAQSIRSGSIQTALVIGSETMSRVLDWQDRSTCVLFGDGAGAIVLKASKVDGGIRSSVLRSDGSGWDALAIPTVGSRDNRLPEANPSEVKMYKMYMNGGAVYRFATRIVGESIAQALADANLKINDLALIVPHQANLRIIQAAARSLCVSTDIFMSNLERYGNTSAASIPIALCEAIEADRISPGDNLVFVGFGAGLTWAACAIQWSVPVDKRMPNWWKNYRRQATYQAAVARSMWRKAVRWVYDVLPNDPESTPVKETDAPSVDGPKAAADK